MGVRTIELNECDTALVFRGNSNALEMLLQKKNDKKNQLHPNELLVLIFGHISKDINKLKPLIDEFEKTIFSTRGEL